MKIKGWPIIAILLFIHLLAASVYVTGKVPASDEMARESLNQIFVITSFHLILLGMALRAKQTNGMGAIMTTSVMASLMFALIGNMFGFVIGLILGALMSKYLKIQSIAFANTLMVLYAAFFIMVGELENIDYWVAFQYDYIQDLLRGYWVPFLFVAICVHLFTNGLPSISLPKVKPLLKKAAAEEDEDEDAEDESDEPQVNSRSQKRKTARNNGVFNRFIGSIWEKLDKLSRS